MVHPLMVNKNSNENGKGKTMAKPEIGNQLGIRGERDTDWKTFILERLVFMRSYSSWRKSHQPAVQLVEKNGH